jgi:hypothetical protein
MSQEAVLEALLASLTAGATAVFTATATAASPTLTSVSNFSGLFAGLPVFGPGVPSGAMILSLNQSAATVTLSSPLASAGTTETFTTGFLTTGRRTQHWSQVSAQPVLFLRHVGTTDTYNGHLPITTLDCEVWIYSNAGKNPDIAPDIQLNVLVQAVRACFVPDDSDDTRFTLGGLAYWCRIEGRSDYAPGDQGGQAIARIPVRITLPWF